VTKEPTDPEILAELRRLICRRTAVSHAQSINARDNPVPLDPERSRRSRQTCHRFSLYEQPRHSPPPETGAYVPELGARLEDDRNLTDGARRCARKLAEYAYRRDRKGRGAEITVTYLMDALGRCRRSVQRYLRLLEREGYVRVAVVYGERSRMCAGLVVQLLAPLFAPHHAKRWPGSAAIPDATAESQNESRYSFRGRTHRRMPVDQWALRCMDGVFRSLMTTLPPLDPRLRPAT
jgi:hypothetical protein